MIRYVCIKTYLYILPEISAAIEMYGQPFFIGAIRTTVLSDNSINSGSITQTSILYKLNVYRHVHLITNDIINTLSNYNYRNYNLDYYTERIAYNYSAEIRIYNMKS